MFIYAYIKPTNFTSHGKSYIVKRSKFRIKACQKARVFSNHHLIRFLFLISFLLFFLHSYGTLIRAICLIFFSFLGRTLYPLSLSLSLSFSLVYVYLAIWYLSYFPRNPFPWHFHILRKRKWSLRI